MAKDKKSFVMYCDQQSIFKMLPDEIAGRLIKHILAYVNDENPVTDDLVLQLAFEPIKMQLKRDLRHWDEVRGKRSESGKLGGRPKKQTEAKKAVNVNVNVTDNVNVNDNDNKDIYRKILHLEITRAEVDKLIADGYTIDQIDNILDRAENWKGIANKRSLYLTAKNWLSADIKKITAEVYRTPKENFLQ